MQNLYNRIDRETWFRSVFEESPVGIELYDAPELLIAANRASREIFGISEDTNLNDVPNLLEKFMTAEARERLTKGETVRHELLFDFDFVRQHNLFPTCKMGQIEIAVSVTPLFSAQERLSGGYMVQIQDVTRTRAAQKALDESQARYRTISELTSDYTYSLRVDSTGKYVGDWVGGAFTQITGYTFEEVIALGGWTQVVVHPDDREILKQRGLRQFASQQPVVDDYRIITRSGEIRWIRDHSYPIWDEDRHHLVRLVGAGRDITDRKRTEESLQRRLQIEELVASISNRFLNAPFDLIENEILLSLKQLGQFTGVNHSYLYLVAERYIQHSLEWIPYNTEAFVIDRVKDHLLDPYGWAINKLKSGETINVVRLNQLPDEADAERNYFSLENIHSLLAFPLLLDNKLIGYFGFQSYGVEKEWIEDDLKLLQLVREILASVLSRRNSEQTVRQNSRQLKRQVEELKTLNDIAEMGANAIDENSLIERVTKIIYRMIPSENFGVLLLDKAAGVLRSHASYQHSMLEPVCPREIPVNGGMAGKAVSEGCAQREGDVDLVPYYIKFAPKTISVLCVPLKTESQVLGVINLEDTAKNAYDESDERLLTAIAGQLATAIAKVRLLEQSSHRMEELEAIISVSAALRHAGTAKEIAALLVDRTVQLFNPSSVSLFLMERDAMTLSYAYGLNSDMVNSGYLLQKGHPLLRVIDSGERLIVLDLDNRNEPKNSTYTTEMMNTASLFMDEALYWKASAANRKAILPLKSADAIVGLIVVIFASGKAELTDWERRVLMAIAEIAGNALNRANLLETLEQRVVERTRLLSTLYDISAASSELLDLNTILQRSLDKILDALNISLGTIHLYDAQEKLLILAVSYGMSDRAIQLIKRAPLRGVNWDWSWVLDATEPVIIKDMGLDARVAPGMASPETPSFIGVPIRYKGHLQGVLSLVGASIQLFTREDVGLLSTVAEQLGVVLENTRLRREAEEIAIINERQRLARELHDSVTQALYSTVLMANGARKLAADQRYDRSMYYLDELVDTSQQALKEMRLLIYELRPSALEQEGLLEALRQRLQTVEQRAGVKAQLNCDVPLTLPARVEEGLYRITLEALNNVLKHAHTTLVIITIHQKKDVVSLEILDNGVGFNANDLQQHTGGLGLKSMRERAEKLGGTFHISSKEGLGTAVSVAINLPE